MLLATDHCTAMLTARGKRGCATIARYVTLSLLVVGGMLFSPQVALAQEIGPRLAPDQWVAPPSLRAPLYRAPADESATGAATEKIHVIVAGDTLTNVAQRYGVEVANLAAYNQILDYNHIVLGQKLRIPLAGMTITAPAVATMPGADGYHVVRQGEALGAIARNYGLTLEALLALNTIDDPNHVRYGTMLRLTEAVELPSTLTQPALTGTSYTVKVGDTLSEIALAHNTTAAQMVEENDLVSEEVHVGQTLRIFPAASAQEAFGLEAPVDGPRKIVIDLSEQTLTAYQGDVVVLQSIVSTGKAATPTRVGEFAIYQKLTSQHMTGDDYDLPGVPWVMYYDGEYAIHGAYWHANFGIPTSHGCTNMTIPESRALFAWAAVGTPVIVQP
jgi:LysM repeat protein